MSGEWITEATVALARELWDQGMAATVIGDRLGATKNAILGLAHRKRWPPRPSPIWRNGALPGVQPRKPKYVRKTPALAPLPSLAEPVPEVEDVAPVAIAVVPPETPALAIAPPPPLCRDCQWPLGDPRQRRAFRYCAEPVLQAGGVYCAPHHALAYVGTARRVAA